MNGIYTAYLTGKSGSGFAMFFIKDNIIVGADMLGALYDGSINKSSDDEFEVHLGVRLPPNTPTIQGAVTGPHGENQVLSFKLPTGFLNEAFIRIETKTGAVNAKFVKVRDLDD